MNIFLLKNNRVFVDRIGFCVSGSLLLAFCVLAQAQDANLNQNSVQAENSAESTEENKDASIPKENTGVVPPIEGNIPKVTPTGVMPLITPLDNSTEAPLDGSLPLPNFNVSPTGVITPFAQPEEAENAQPENADANTETEALPESEQQQAATVFGDGSLVSGNNSILPTLSLGPTLGSANGSISELAGLITPGMNSAYSKRGLSFTAVVTEMYDTNPARLPASQDFEGDWLTSGSIQAAYLPIVQSTWSVNARYQAGYNWYLENENFNAFFQSGAAIVAYDGARLDSNLQVSLTSGTAPNRDVAAVLEQTNFSVANNSRYTLSPLTSIDAQLSYALFEINGAVVDSREDIVGRIAGVWHYSPLTEIGFGLRASEQILLNGSSRVAVGPSISARYKFSDLLSFNTQLAMEYGTINDENANGVDAGLGLSYKPSQLWLLSFSYRRSNQPMVGAAATFQVLDGLNFNLSREFSNATATIGIGYEQATMESIGSSAVISDRKFMTVDASYQCPLYMDRLFGSVFVRYADQQDKFFSWESMQMGLRITHLF